MNSCEEKRMIRLENVSKRLGKFQLENLTFEIPEGYICGLVGLNGAGKTTLLHLILGLYYPQEGRVEIDGSLYENTEKEIHDEIGTVLTEELFDPGLTLMENAEEYGRYYSRFSRVKMEEYLSRFGLQPKQRFGRLSKGQKLKAQFAFALSHDPKLLILDEPTANFDPQFREQFLEVLTEFMEDGKRSVILATHLTEDLDRLADYLIYLENGKQIFAGDIESFREGYRIVSGESYKIRLLPPDRILHLEEKPYGAKALVKHGRQNHYDKELQINYPTIEEFMYFYSKRYGKSH
ncbi:MAG: ABC transporter ATP-binding protein [Lachnospiraceae bacterium]|nr:ABC transporter ATP-binding protein [Lachnospiraceae bacterium]